MLRLESINEIKIPEGEENGLEREYNMGSGLGLLGHSLNGRVPMRGMCL